MTVAGEIHGMARMVIRDGKLDELTVLVERCIQLVRERDTGTLEQELYLDESRGVCFVHERCRDSDAGLVHMATIGDVAAALESAGVTIYAPFRSFDHGA